MSTNNIQDQRLRLLIVEDEFPIANQIAEFFVRHGAELVGFAPTVGKANKIIDSGAPVDAAILDVRVGSADVFEVADYLSKAGTCMLFYTAQNPADFPPRFRDAPIVSKLESMDKLHERVMEAYLDLQRQGAARCI